MTPDILVFENIETGDCPQVSGPDGVLREFTVERALERVGHLPIGCGVQDETPVVAGYGPLVQLAAHRPECRERIGRRPRRSCAVEHILVQPGQVVVDYIGNRNHRGRDVPLGKLLDGEGLVLEAPRPCDVLVLADGDRRGLFGDVLKLVADIRAVVDLELHRLADRYGFTDFHEFLLERSVNVGPHDTVVLQLHQGLFGDNRGCE